jgi:hypothetical protein
MRGADLLVLYGLVGLACAVAIYRREKGKGPSAVWAAAAAVPLWPLWAPFVLGPAAPTRPAAPPKTNGVHGVNQARFPLSERGAIGRIGRALDEAVDAVAGTPMSDVFPPEAAERIASEVTRLAERMNELSELSARHGLDVEASRAKLEELEQRGAPERAVATARVQHESLCRLERLKMTDGEALEELADLMEALRAQLLLARYEGSLADGTGAIVNEVWARLEGLGGVAEATAP